MKYVWYQVNTMIDMFG